MKSQRDDGIRLSQARSGSETLGHRTLKIIEDTKELVLMWLMFIGIHRLRN